AREARVLEEIRDDAIVRGIAHGTTPEGEPWIAMEWLDGDSLRKWIGAGPLAVNEALVIGARIAGALAVVHDRGVIHRDVKPSNIFLRGGRIEGTTLLDFGVARAPHATPLTKSGDVIGTPGYMAPEQARGSTALDARADLFGLGALLFRCL